MSQTEQKPSNLSSSFDHIPDIDADEQSWKTNRNNSFVVFYMKINYFF